jgi:hypothetical protein
MLSLPIDEAKPEDADRLKETRRLDPSAIRRLVPSEIAENFGHDALCVAVIARDKHRRVTALEVRVDEVGIADDVECLNDARLGCCPLNVLAARPQASFGGKPSEKSSGFVASITTFLEKRSTPPARSPTRPQSPGPRARAARRARPSRRKIPGGCPVPLPNHPAFCGSREPMRTS